MTISNIITLVRYLINDTASNAIDIYTYESSNIFTLSESNVIAITDVLVNDVSTGVSYSYDTTNNKLTITSAMNSGDTVQIEYTCYQNYSDTEIEAYVRSAFVHLSVMNYYTFKIEDENDIYPEPSDEEKNLLAMVTTILIEPSISIRLPDLSIGTNEKLTPTDKIRVLLASFKKNKHGVFGTLINY